MVVEPACTAFQTSFESQIEAGPEQTALLAVRGLLVRYSEYNGFQSDTQRGSPHLELSLIWFKMIHDFGVR